MEQLKQLGTKECAAIGIVLAVLYYFLVFDGGQIIQSQINTKVTEIQAQKDTLARIKKAIEDKRKFDQEAEEINTNIEAFLVYFPTALNENEFMKSISKAAEENTSTVLTLKPVAKAPEFPNYPEMAFEFEVEGIYTNIMKFIADLTQLKRAIDFQDMKLTVVAQEEFPRIKLSATIIAFGHKPESNPGAGQ